MSFRIIKTERDSAEDGETIPESYKVYRKHMKKYLDTACSDLLKFFYWDFFHDGWIDYITIQKDFKTVEMKITCPNIQRQKDDGEWEYINVPFICTFGCVAQMDYKCDPPEDYCHARMNSIEYIHGELNTSPLLNTYYIDDDDESPLRYSLLMELRADDSTIWLESVFFQVDVEACEPTAFALMEVDPKFKVPTFSIEKEEQRDCSHPLKRSGHPSRYMIPVVDLELDIGVYR